MKPSCPDQIDGKQKYYGMQLFSDDLSDEHMRCIANRLTQRKIKDLRILSKLCIMLGLSKKGNP